MVVVGTRCAGAPTAMLLGRKGYRVLMVDRAAFPSDRLSTHYVHQAGISRLRHWGVLDRLVATGCPPSTTFTLDLGTITLKGTPAAADGTSRAYAPRRRVLDQVLIDAATAAGVEFRERFAVESLATEDGRVTGIRGRDEQGRTVSEHARVVVGADGLHSAVARLVGAPVYEDRGTLTCAYYSYWSGVPVDGCEVFARDGCAFAAFATHDEMTCIPVFWPVGRFDEVRADPEDHYLAAIDRAPSLAERVRSGRREERLVGTNHIPNMFRKPWGEGWALVGDAGHHKDPSVARGITDAFVHCELLVDALDAGLSDRTGMDDALSSYEQQRNAEAMPMFDFTCRLAALEPPARDMQQLLDAVHGDSQATEGFLGLIAGTTDFARFFDRRNIGRILTGARRRSGTRSTPDVPRPSA